MDIPSLTPEQVRIYLREAARTMSLEEAVEIAQAAGVPQDVIAIMRERAASTQLELQAYLSRN